MKMILIRSFDTPTSDEKRGCSSSDTLPFFEKVSFAHQSSQSTLNQEGEDRVSRQANCLKPNLLTFEPTRCRQRLEDSGARP